MSLVCASLGKVTRISLSPFVWFSARRRQGQRLVKSLGTRCSLVVCGVGFGREVTREGKKRNFVSTLVHVIYIYVCVFRYIYIGMRISTLFSKHDHLLLMYVYRNI